MATSRVQATGRFRVGEGEEARLTPGAAWAAEVRSRGPLPLRVRREALHHARPAFAGTAVVLGDATYEVVAEQGPDAGGSMVYGLRPWPAGEIFRDRVVYGAPLVRCVEARRGEERLRARARRWRLLLYPLVGMLPEEPQARLCERLGLYSVTATLAGGLAESAFVMSLLGLLSHQPEEGKAIMMVTAAPGLALLVLPGLGRAFGALFLRESGGSPLGHLAAAVLRALGTLPRRPAAGSRAPLTRREFWRRLAAPDQLQPQPDGGLLLRSALPHLGWDGSRRLEAGGDYWGVEPLPPTREAAGLAYCYRLVPLGEPPPAGAEGPAPAGAEGPARPSPFDYRDEVMGGVRLEWDAFNSGFAWLTSLLAAEVQARAFAHHGGPPAVRRATLATAAGGALLGVYLLQFLPGPPGDPLAPLVLATGVLLLVDAGRRLQAARGARYAPSLLRWLMPPYLLRPERLAFHAHRDAEREALEQQRRP